PSLPRLAWRRDARVRGRPAVLLGLCRGRKEQAREGCQKEGACRATHAATGIPKEFHRRLRSVSFGGPWGSRERCAPRLVGRIGARFVARYVGRLDARVEVAQAITERIDGWRGESLLRACGFG